MMWMLAEKDRHACRVCAVWECEMCGWRRQNAARLRPEKQHCAKCQSTLGHFNDMRHMHPRIQREHDEDARELIDGIARDA